MTLTYYLVLAYYTNHFFADINLEKHSGRNFLFGESVVRLSGDLAKRTVVTDNTVQIALPEESGVRKLNLIYNTPGPTNSTNPALFPNNLTVPSRVVPDNGACVPLEEQNAGRFNFATNETIKRNAGGTFKLPNKTDVELLKRSETDKYYTSYRENGEIDSTFEDRKQFVPYTDGEFTGAPVEVKWNSSYNDSGNFYSKYLLQQELEERAVRGQRAAGTKVSKSFPEVVRRRRSFTLDTFQERDSFYRRVREGEIPLQVTF